MENEQKYSSVVFEIVGFCNARCPWCITGNKSLKHLSYPAKSISMDDFQNAIDRLIDGGFIYPGESVIDLYNWGEPMLHPELNAILKILRKNNIKFTLSTNASKVVHLENDALSNLQELKFSLPGFSQSAYNRIHGFNFETILKNIESFCENIRGEGSKAKLVMSYHLYQFNLDEIRPAIRFCRLNGIEFSPIFAYLADFYMAKAFLAGSIHQELLGRIAKDLFLHYVDELIAKTPQDYKCPQFNILTIDEDCNIITCCFLPKGHTEYSLGKLSALSYTDVRKSKLSQAVCGDCIKSGAAYWVHNPVTPDYIKILGDGLPLL